MAAYPMPEEPAPSLLGLITELEVPFYFVMFAVACPTLMLGSPTMLEPTVPRGETECTLGCTSVVPVPDMAPTGLPIKDVALLDLLCKMLSTVFSMKIRLFFIVSSRLFGLFEMVCGTFEPSLFCARLPPG